MTETNDEIVALAATLRQTAEDNPLLAEPIAKLAKNIRLLAKDPENKKLMNETASMASEPASRAREVATERDAVMPCVTDKQALKAAQVVMEYIEHRQRLYVLNEHLDMLSMRLRSEIESITQRLEKKPETAA